MSLERNLNPPLRVLYVACGVGMIAVALYAHLLLPGLAVVLLVVAGVLAIASGAYGH